MMKMEKLLLENEATYYTAEYYSNESGHGDLGFDKDFDKALARARKFENQENNNDIEYIGVVGDGTEFAILKIDKAYIKDRLNPLDFKDKRAYKNFMKVAQKVLSTGKMLKGNFDN